MSAEKIIGEWKKNVFKPIYWLEGEESFFIDQVVSYAEHKILNEAEAGFNLTEEHGSNFYRIPADFLIDPDGIIREAFYSELVGEHINLVVVEAHLKAQTATI